MGTVPLLGTTPGRRRRRALPTAALALALLALVAPSASAATLFGTVSTQPAGAPPMPAAGATVTVLDAGTAATVSVATTGLDGSYSLAIPSGTYDVRFDPAAGEDFAATTVHDIAVATSRKLDVVLVPDGVVRLSGVLRRADGTPLAGATVYAGDFGIATATTDDSGAYSLAVLPGTYPLYAYGIGLEGLPAYWSLNAGRVGVAEDRALDLTLPATVALTVRVLGADDAPIAGADVAVPGVSGGPLSLGDVSGYVSSAGEGGGYSGTTDGAGEVRFAVFDGTGTAGDAVVTPPADSGYAQERAAVPAVSGDTTLVVRLQATVRLTGVLRDATGAPVADASVYLGDFGVARATTDADGSYALAVVPGTYPLYAYGIGLEGLPAYWSLNAGSVSVAEDRTLDLTLPATAVVTVRVLGADDAPIAGADVRVPGLSGGPLSLGELSGHVSAAGEGGGYSGTTDGAGEVRFLAFDRTSTSGRATVTPPPGSGYAQETALVPDVEGDTTLVVRLQATARLTGVLRDATGAPVADAQVYLGDFGIATATTDASGAYALAVPPGAYPLYAYGVGLDGLPWHWSLNAGTVGVAADRSLDLTLPPIVTLTVRVVGASEEPIVGASVAVPGLSGGPLSLGDVSGYVSSAGEGGGYSGTTDGAGEVRFLVFDRTGTSGRATVRPPPVSGYVQTSVAVPTVEGDTTLVVQSTRLDPDPPDTAAPSVSCDSAPAGWHADEVSVACAASDAGSGLADPADASFSLSTDVGDGNEDASAQTGTREVCDRAGNCVTAGPFGPVSVDGAAPVLAFSQQPDGANGWWRSSLASVHATASDLSITSLDCALDGVPQALVPTSSPGALALDVSAAGEGRHSVSCTATDAVGHITDGSEGVRIDLTGPNAPLLAAGRAPDFAGRGGWFRDTVAVSVVPNGDPPLADGTPGSGIDPASVPAAQALSRSGNHTVTGGVADLAGNPSATATATFKVDADPPESTLDCPARVVRVGVRATARWKDRDGESGLSTAASGSIALDTSRAGTYTVQHTAADNVGHSATSSCTYTVA